jgi:hypothetical protein
MTRTLLQETNPVSLHTAFVQDDGRFVSLILMFQASANYDPQQSSRSKSTPLYRRKRPILSELLFVIGLANLYEQSPHRINSTPSNGNMLRRWLRRAAYRWFLIRYERIVRPMTFSRPPEFRLLWTESGNSVALLLNGEPWAYIHEEKNHGYSRGNLKPGYGNTWDQESFEKTFL